MSRNTKIIIAVILVILVIVICCCTFMKKDEKESKTSENIINNETVENLVEANVIDNTVVNEVIENKVVEKEEPIIENVTEVKPQGTVYESKTDAGTTDKKQEAIALVKEKWGEDSTVTFRCDSVSTNGEYVIAVVSKESASVKNYFKVNLKTKTVEVDY